MARGITILRYFQRRYIEGATEGFRWRIEVAEAREMPAAVFLYKKAATKLYDAQTGGLEPPEEVEWAGVFNGVASASDLEDYPEGEPRVNEFPPFYRLDWLDQAFPSKHFAMKAYDATIGQLNTLIETLDIMDDLTASPPLVLGAPPPASA
jgi:hypothetical protein